eukprot:3339366-Pleurochrysis_carterae.AAC.1
MHRRKLGRRDHGGERVIQGSRRASYEARKRRSDGGSRMRMRGPQEESSGALSSLAFAASSAKLSLSR